MQAPQLKHWVLLILLSLAWGFAFYLIAVALELVPGHTHATPTEKADVKIEKRVQDDAVVLTDR